MGGHKEYDMSESCIFLFHTIEDTYYQSSESFEKACQERLGFARCLRDTTTCMGYK